MRSAERQLKMRELFAAGNFVDIETLSRDFGVSPSSIRRDLMLLERKGLLQRVHGGALNAAARENGSESERPFVVHQDEKSRIGRSAAVLVEDGETLILSGGTTVTEVARSLFARHLQVITNCIGVAQEFWDCKNIEVTMTGGYLLPRLDVQLGPLCDAMLSGISADTLILGAAGVDASGLSESNSLLVSTLRKMIEMAQRVIVVADHTKFGRRSIAQIAPLDAIDIVVTDRALAPEYREMLRQHQIETVCA